MNCTVYIIFTLKFEGFYFKSIFRLAGWLSFRRGGTKQKNQDRTNAALQCRSHIPSHGYASFYLV